MTYTPTNWIDRSVQYPSKFSMVTNPDGTITLTPAPGTITNAGTPITATALNNLETQYSQAVTDIETWVTNQGYSTISSFAKSFGISGYQKLPNGLILQWGYGTYSSGATVPFPITFPSNERAISVQPHASTPQSASVSSSSTNGFVIQLSYSPLYVYWFAIGY